MTLLQKITLEVVIFYLQKWELEVVLALEEGFLNPPYCLHPNKYRIFGEGS